MRRAILLALMLAACGNTDMSVDGYDQTCEIANTCRAVYVGDVCECECDIDAISYTETTRWAAERSRKQRRCDELRSCAPCPSITLDCVDQTCVAETGSGAGAASDTASASE
ncbi:MAG: hypothetical protein EA397_00220 [Deltaproteobacteria bacterium]|nr:MAG: hypothetical protein EA397_00220 [Deltaproteobacteria bacterium]